MRGAEEEWVKAAMSDDTMVVELLVRLHSTATPPPSPMPETLPLDWSVRQRRSRPVSANSNPKKQAQRASPITPLSWSGATSLSGGSGGTGGGDEESSRPTTQKLSSPARSKGKRADYRVLRALAISISVNGDSDKNVSKRTRKKKTLAALKDEESSLLKERRELKRELAALRVNLDKQRTTNQKLKKMKVELLPLPDTETTSALEESVSDQLHHTATADPTVSNNTVSLQPSISNGCPEPNSVFVLPDLNMPFEEDPCPDVVCGVS